MTPSLDEALARLAEIRIEIQRQAGHGMSNSDAALAGLFRDMRALIESHRLNLSEAELAQCRGFVAMTQMLCAEATQHCTRMGYSDEQARAYMRGLLAALVERQQLNVTMSAQGVMH